MVNLIPTLNADGDVVFVNQMETHEGRATHLAMKAPILDVRKEVGAKAKAATAPSKEALDTSQL